MKNINFNLFKIIPILIIVSFLHQCKKDDDSVLQVKDPETATIAEIDRFSDNAEVLMKRSKNPDLPEINEAINFDVGDFITQGLGPNGQVVKYYNFDVQPLALAPIYVLFKHGSLNPVENQLNIIDVIPGDAGYSDFWQIYKVTVPDNYIANTVASFSDILSLGYSIEKTNIIVNCPVVPKGSIASLRFNNESSALDTGWYKNEIVYYFNFTEKELTTNPAGLMPISPIYVTFNINPDSSNPSSGVASGAKMETGSLQTHNVIATIPSDNDYSPLWSVYVYDNTDFNSVSNLQTAQAANILVQGVMYVNCPVVHIGL